MILELLLFSFLNCKFLKSVLNEYLRLKKLPIVKVIPNKKLYQQDFITVVSPLSYKNKAIKQDDCIQI